MSDSDKKPKIPPPDDFSKTTPNININNDDDSSGWDKTNYNIPVETPADDWGKTVINYDVSSHEDSADDLNSTHYSNNSPKEPDWGMTQANINVNQDFEAKDDNKFEDGSTQYGATTPYFKLPEAEREKYQNIPLTPTEKAFQEEKEKKEKGGVPMWFWVSAGLMVMFSFAVIVLFGVWYIFLNNKGFDVVVKGAPAGSKFYVDDSEWGVPSTSNEHRLYGLEPGTRKIAVVHPNYKCNSEEITGKDGESQPFIPRCETAVITPEVNKDCEKTLDERTRESCAEEILDGLANPPDLDKLLRALNLLRINFATGSAEVPERNKRILQKAAGHIKNLPPSVVIEVGGHTDDVGKDDSNQRLSEKRAESVKSLFISFGVNETRITSKGYGEGKPEADNNTTEGKARNRRIAYTIVSK